MADRPTADEYVATVRRLQAAAEADQRHLVALITFLTGEAPTGPVQAWEVTDALGVVLGIDASRVGEEGYTLRSVLWGDGKLPPIANRYRAAQEAKGLRQYGQTLAEANLSVEALARHAAEEAVDLPAYLRAMADRMASEGSTRATRAMWAAREIERAAWAVLVGLAPEPGEVSP